MIRNEATESDMDYLVKFARYRDGETRINGSQFIRGESFDDAFKIANDRIRGMIAADPDSKFYIERIEARGIQPAIECEGGVHMFETVDEFSARVAQAEAANHR